MSLSGRQVLAPPQQPPATAFFSNAASSGAAAGGANPIPNASSMTQPTSGSAASADDASQPPAQAPVTTVFVGNISERAPDAMLKAMLQLCGFVYSWKRVQGATGKPQAFGFCEYERPEATLRCVRLLNGLTLADDKSLLVKVDAKTQTLLDEYKNKRSKKSGAAASKRSGEEGELPDAEGATDENTRQEDAKIRLSLEQILREYAAALAPSKNEPEAPAAARASNTSDDGVSVSAPPLDERHLHEHRERYHERHLHASRNLEGPKHLTIEDMQLDSERRVIVNREIENFRNRYKEGEATDDDAAEARERELQEKRAARRRELDRERERRDAAEARERERRAASARGRRSRSPVNGAGGGAPEDDEDEAERKRLERKLRDKEAAYQERLKQWEARERKKAREREAQLAKEAEREAEEAREARRLREFLRDYADERDDAKFYKRDGLQRRMKAREREMEADARDRAKEKDELDELRKRLRAEAKPGADAVLAAAEAARDAHLRRRLRECVNGEATAPSAVASTEAAARSALPRLSARAAALASASSADEQPEQLGGRGVGLTSEQQRLRDQKTLVELPAAIPLGSPTTPSPAAATGSGHVNGQFGAPAPVLGSGLQFSIGRASGVSGAPADVPDSGAGSGADYNDDNDSPHASPARDDSSPDAGPAAPPAGTGFGMMQPQRKKPTLAEVFNQDDEDAPAAAPAGFQLDDASQNAEDKRQCIKKLIDMIPTQKEDLFKFPLDWSIVDAGLMEKRIKPWVNKKIVEYIGEEEASLSQFICSKVMAHAQPETVLNDIAMVLDEEAEVFVVKMWRLLIYETEAKKAGLVK